MAHKRALSKDDSDIDENIEMSDDDAESFSYVPLKLRKAKEQEDAKNKLKHLLSGDQIAQHSGSSATETCEKEIEKIVVPVGGDVRKNKPSLLDQHSKLQSVKKENEISEAAKQRDEERKLLEYVAEKTALKAVQEIAKNILYTEPIKTTWTCPKWLLDKYPSYHEKVRQKLNIEVEGEDCPPPIKWFNQMKLPSCVISALAKKDIKTPTAIQVQALPVILAGLFTFINLSQNDRF